MNGPSFSSTGAEWADDTIDADGFPVRRASARSAKAPAYLSGISAKALMAMQFAPINYVVPGYLAEGLTWKIVGAAHEVGKTDERQAILDVLLKEAKPMTAREIRIF